MKHYLRIGLILLVAVQGYGAFQTRYRPSSYALYSWQDEETLVMEHLAAKWSPRPLLEAGMIASGADTKEQLLLLTQIFELAYNNIRQQTRNIHDPALLATRVLALFHATLFQRYHATRTTLVHVLDSGDFNCVSSAMLYNIALTRMGFRTRAVTVPGHVYSQVLIKGQWIEVETTHPQGFNPLRLMVPAAQAGGRMYIPDKGDPRKKQVLDNRFFTALLYYNRGTLSFHDPDPLIPIVLFVKSLLIFPGHNEAEKNLLAIFARWISDAVTRGETDIAVSRIEEARRALGSRSIFDKLLVQAHEEGAAHAVKRDDFKEAIRILQRLRAAVVDRDGSVLRQIQGYYAQWAQSLLEQHKHEDMLTVINSAQEKWPSPFLDNFKVHLVTYAAQQFFLKGNPSGGILFYNTHLPYLNESRAMMLNRQHLYNEWGKYELAKNSFENAYEAYRYALIFYPGGQLFLSGKSEVVRQWVTALIRQKKPDDWPQTVWELFSKHSDIGFLQELHKPFMAQMEAMLHKLDFARAYAILEKLRIQISHIPGLLDVDRELIRVIGEWGRYTLAQRAYKESTHIFKSGLIRYPDRDEFLAGLKQAYSRHARQLMDTGQYTEAKRIIKEALFHFPDHKGLQKMAAYFPVK